MNQVRKFVKGFQFAGVGIARTLRSERNMRVHFAAATAVILFNLLVRPSTALVMSDLAACVVVISGELLNTAIETVADLSSGGVESDYVRVAKDAAAGGVLALAIGAVCVGIYVFVKTFPWKWQLFSASHPLGAGMSLGALVFVAWSVVGAMRHR